MDTNVSMEPDTSVFRVQKLDDAAASSFTVEEVLLCRLRK
jgi:hypothetical protein